MENVSEVTVYGEKNTIIGNIVCAKVKLDNEEIEAEFAPYLKKYCSKKLEKYKIPVKVAISDNIDISERFKKVRKY